MHFKVPKDTINGFYMFWNETLRFAVQFKLIIHSGEIKSEDWTETSSQISHIFNFRKGYKVIKSTNNVG